MFSEEIIKTALNCRHYAMCKIDFLDIGICLPGKENYFVSYYPQGRMDIVSALSKDQIPYTEELIKIADSCNLCGICQKQCYFYSELKPLAVMDELKRYVENKRKNYDKPIKLQFDSVYEELKVIVGAKWVSNDPAILICYSHDPGPFTEMIIPQYVVLPSSEEEISAIVKLCNSKKIAIAVRGNGSSVFGLVFCDGLIMDMTRMKKLEIDKENFKATIGAGITAYQLQKESKNLSLRANVAEPAATVCANLICSGIFSTFSSSYGTAADNFIEARFVDFQTGNIFSSNDRSSPNIFAFLSEAEAEGGRPAGICTEVSVKLYPIPENEKGILVPFDNFADALNLARELAERRIGNALGVLGQEYISTFISPTDQMAKKFKKVLEDNLNIKYALLVIGDEYAIKAVQAKCENVIDQELFEKIVLGLPKFLDDEWMELLVGITNYTKGFDLFCKKEMSPLIETILQPSCKNLEQIVDKELAKFYVELYAKGEVTDLVLSNSFRIISSRMGRDKHVVALILYVPINDAKIIEEINSSFKIIADDFGIKNDYGFLTPIDFGKIAILEYDYYIDHTDQKQIDNIKMAFSAINNITEKLSSKFKGITHIKNIFGQGMARKESFLYR
ncbi:MAG: FAD-binding oxidoreductase [Oligoflexia bacterium]|nr:FAD-binding oxidoreductase [Oligoflexia bacterium]